MGLVAIQTDSREPAWVKDLSFGGVPVIVTLLEAGDLLAATDDGQLLAVERKASGDLLNTLRDDRLFPQISRLREISPWAYLVVTGDLRPGPGGKTFVDGRETGWAWASVQGALCTVQELGVCVVQVGSDYDYEATIIRLANRSRDGIRVAPARDVSIMGEAEMILSSLPGIGAEKAAVLLRECGDAHTALHYLTVWERHWIHAPVPGIGDGTRRRVRKALGLPEELFLMAGVFQERDRDGDKGSGDTQPTDPHGVGNGAVYSANDVQVAAVRGDQR